MARTRWTRLPALLLVILISALTLHGCTPPQRRGDAKLSDVADQAAKNRRDQKPIQTRETEDDESALDPLETAGLTLGLASTTDDATPGAATAPSLPGGGGAGKRVDLRRNAVVSSWLWFWYTGQSHSPPSSRRGSVQAV